MSFKLIPFDLDQARNGAEVCLEDGTAVEIVNFNLRVGTFPILGRFTYGGIECYEVWPKSGTYRDEIGLDGAPQDLKIRQDLSEDDDPDETDYEAELDYQGQVSALRDDLAEARQTIKTLKKELADWRKNYDKLVARVKDYASPEAFKRAQDELEASRHNYAQACLRIKELDAVVEKERRERQRLEVWQKETLVALKDWRQVEDFVNAEDGRADGEIGLEAWAVVLGRLKTLRDLTAMLKKF